MANLNEIKKLAITMHLNGDDVSVIMTATDKSERTIYRYIEEYKDGLHDKDMAEIKKTVNDFKKDEALDLLAILKSNSYTKRVKTALSLIDEDAMRKDMNIRGIGNVTRFIGTMIDKRLKSYAIDLEKENLELKKTIASSSRQIVFVGEEQVYEDGVKLSTEHTTNIS